MSERSNFGFEAGGQAKIEVESKKLVIFGLIKMREYEEDRNIIWNMSEYCGDNRTKVISQYQASCLGSGTLEAVIEEKDVYVPFYVLCETLNFSWSGTTATYSFRNANGWLDYRWDPSKLYLPILVGLHALILVVWLINWFVYGHPKIKVHRWISYGLLAGLIMHCILYLTIIIRDRRGYPIYVFRQIDLGIVGFVWDNIYNIVLLIVLDWTIASDRIVDRSISCRGITIFGIAGQCLMCILLITERAMTMIRNDSGLIDISVQFCIGNAFNILGFVLFSVGILMDMKKNTEDLSFCLTAAYDMVLQRRYRLTKLFNVVVRAYLCLKIGYMGFIIYTNFNTQHIYYNWLIYGAIDAVFWFFVVVVFRLHRHYRSDYVVDEVPPVREFDLVDKTIINENILQYKALVAQMNQTGGLETYWTEMVPQGTAIECPPDTSQFVAIYAEYKGPGRLMMRAHVAYVGWMPWVPAGSVCGNNTNRLEALKFRLEDADSAQISFTASVLPHGRDWLSAGFNAVCGTTGLSKKLTGLKISMQLK